MKKIIGPTILILVFGSPLLSSAFYQVYSPAERTLEIAVPELIITYENGIQTTVVQPEFEGTADSFLLLMLAPNEVTVKEVPEAIVQDILSLAGEAQEEREDIFPLAIETTYHTDYSINTYRTSSLDEFIELLDEKQYVYTQEDIATIQEYESFVGYNLVAIEVHVSDTAATNTRGFYGTLTPLALEYQSIAPVIHLDLATSISQVDTYLLSEEFRYIPGIDTIFAQQVDSSEFLHAQHAWLVQQNMSFDPTLSTQALFALVGEEYIVDESNSPRVFNSEFLRKETGVIYTQEEVEENDSVGTYEELLESTRLLTYGVSGDDVISLQRFLNTNIQTSLVEDGIWGPATDRAVQQFQQQYNLAVDGIVGEQTRGFIQTLLEE